MKDRIVKVAIIGGMCGLSAALRAGVLDVIAEEGLKAYEFKRQFNQDISAACLPPIGKGKGDRIRRRQQWSRK